MEIDYYFNPVNMSGYEYSDKTHKRRLGDIVRSYNSEGNFPGLEDIDIALIGVPEERNAFENEGCSKAPDNIRDFLYALYEGEEGYRLADLGNIKPGNTTKDTYFALTSVVSYLISNNIIPVILGGSQDLTFPVYKAYEKLGQIINIAAIDPLFDLGNKDEELNARSYLSKIILHQPNYLFNYTNIGYQTYFVDHEAIDLMENLFFDCYRLGWVRSEIEEVEPMVRNADLITVDVSAIRYSDAPGNRNATPNGFFGHEVCQISRYAGLSNKLTSIGFFETNPSRDQHGQTAHLVAQMIWYFLEGFYNRPEDDPQKDKKHFIKYTVSIKDHKDQIVFYKSRKSDRWWMVVPIKSSLRIKYERHHYIPCSYKDYETALNDEIPDRWWQAYQKLM